MNRRSFVKLSGLSTALLAVGVTGYLTVFKGSESVLTDNLAIFYNPAFKEVAATLDAGKTLRKLRTSGVIEENGTINHSVITKQAKTDAISEVGNRYYSQTELELYGLAYLITGENVVKLVGHDLMGGDSMNYKVADAAACHQACQTDDSCTGYTFVKNTHPRAEKHKMCYLKNGKVKYKIDDNYISGIR